MKTYYILWNRCIIRIENFDKFWQSTFQAVLYIIDQVRIVHTNGSIDQLGIKFISLYCVKSIKISVLKYSIIGSYWLLHSVWLLTNMWLIDSYGPTHSVYFMTNDPFRAINWSIHFYILTNMSLIDSHSVMHGVYSLSNMLLKDSCSPMHGAYLLTNMWLIDSYSTMLVQYVTQWQL